MARFWLVRSGTTAVDLQPDHLAVTIVSRRTPRMSVGDTVLFLEMGGEQMRFTATARIVRIVPFQSESVEEPKLTKVELKSPVSLPEGLNLDTLWYSLTIVRNTSKPDVHFRRGYRLLPQEDFETIKKGDPFLARSGYFELLNALPQSLRAAFEAEQVLLAGQARERVTFRERLERLYAFIDQRVLAVDRLLRELAEVTAELDLDGAPIEHWFVSEPDPAEGLAARPDGLAVQLQRFEELRAALTGDADDQIANGGRDFIDETLRQLDLSERRPIEARFERLFAAAT